MRAGLGEEKYAALRRASDSDLRTIDALVSRLNLPTTTTSQVASARDTYAAESQRINADSSLSMQDRRAKIQELAQRAKTEVTQLLGSEAADAYSQRSSWLSFLQNGMAYSTTPSEAHGNLMPFGGQSVFPVPPAGMAGPAGNRQVMSFSAGAVSSAGAAGYAVPVFAPAHMDNVQFTGTLIVAPGSAAPPPAVQLERPKQ
jgi:hypothetical protein